MSNRPGRGRDRPRVGYVGMFVYHAEQPAGDWPAGTGGG